MTRHRLGLALTGATALFLVLASGALGILGPGGRPDRVYAAVLAVLVLGATLSRLRSPGMALTLLATAATQAAVTAVALAMGLPPEGSSVVDVLGINAMFIALWGLCAWLVRPPER
ncbi:hypothetical protein LRP67_13770 [Nocardioides sp. cx-169]|uniref:hypothetical protein n=1 Tax=Nocardioides sp. cx-169 TaxID=2899080 RepID=UPI001E3EFBF7|nr:hypothetical protein [Nocardioides sp. cx-169]MCD4535156.1 hypothetical protein [Nocardioides sp. cx-169]